MDSKLRSFIPLHGFATLTVVLGVLIVLGFSGCKVGPNYTPPEIATPDAWEQAVLSEFQDGEPDLRAWWSAFEDPVLDSLINYAGMSNVTLKIAATRVNEARVLRGLAKADFWPTLQGGATAEIRRYSEETVPLLGPDQDRVTGFYAVGASAAWELDVWGRVRRNVESATASLEAQIEDFRDTLVILYSEVALTYIEVRTLQERIYYAQRNAESQAGSVNLTSNLFSAGLVPDLDVNQAKLNLARTQSQIPTLRTQLAQALNRLSVLTGRYPGAVEELANQRQPIPVPPELVEVGLPANLLRQRPDVRRAERLLASQSARIGVAKADLYPGLFLPGTLALEAFKVSNLNAGSLAYSFGPQIRWNLFSGGRVRNQIKAEEFRTQGALQEYELTVLRAVEETENSMVAFAEEGDRKDYLTQSRDAAQRSVELVKELYQAGLTQFQNVLDMERSLTAEDDALARSRGLLAGDLVLVYKALGGGWSWDPTNAPTAVVQNN